MESKPQGFVDAGKDKNVHWGVPFPWPLTPPGSSIMLFFFSLPLRSHHSLGFNSHHWVKDFEVSFSSSRPH